MMRHANIRWTAIIVAWGLLVGQAAAASAATDQPLVPMAVYGTVETTGGAPVPRGQVQAWLGGQPSGAPLAIAADGSFGGPGGLDPKLTVSGTDADAGQPLSFTVNGLPATAALGSCLSGSLSGPSVTWQSGATCAVSLSVAPQAATAGLTVDPALGGATVGLPYTTHLLVQGGRAPYTWSVAPGSSLPSWLALTPSGTLSGTPTAAGPEAFMLLVSDSSSPVLSAPAPLAVLVAPSGVTAPATDSASTTSETAPAIAGGIGTDTPDTMATASGGTGTVVTGLYGGDPDASATPTFSDSGVYFDISVSAGSTFQTLDLQQCGLAAGSTLYWLDGSTWTAVAPQTQTGACIGATLNTTTSSPPIDQLTATPFTVSGGNAAGGGGGAAGGVVAPPASVPASAPPASPTAGVGAGGGSLTTADGAFSLVIPANAITGNGVLSVSEATTPPASLPPGMVLASPVFVLTGSSLAKPQPATIDYDASVLGGLDPLRLSVYAGATAGGWDFVPTRVDAAAGTVSAEVSGPEMLAVLVAQQRFSDVASTNWAAPDIDALLAAGIASGFPDGTFAPDGVLTRAQFVKLLDRTLNLPVLSGPQSSTTGFADVSAADWFAPYVAAAVAAGVVDGTSPTTFSPNDPVTREQMAVILARALKLSGSTELTFSDAPQVDPWALAGVEATVADGYMAGFPDGRFEPQGPTTRAEAAKVLAAVIAQRAPPPT